MLIPISKKPLSIIVSVLCLSACQTTSFETNKQTQVNYYPPESIATPNEITDALLADETADVVHPVDDVDMNLSDQSLAVADDIWQRIRANIQFDIPNNKRIAIQRNWYVKHPEYLDRVAKRAEPFIYYIIEQLEKNNMPIELALLPIVESAYDPFAYSHGRASGMWQFVPRTGTRFDMKQNWWYDGRRDVIASTQGAIEYLKYLYEFFDQDWLLALAAYNSGEGRVRRAVKYNLRKKLPIDFWSLDLPKETRDYVPKLLALADIVKNSEQYGIKWYEIENKPLISIAEIPGQIDLAKAAELANVSLAELQRLNPGFNRWATDPNGPNYLVIPKKNEQSFKTRLANLKPEERISWQRYKIRSGDSLSKIANKFHTTTAMIRTLNGLKSNNIRAGKYLLVPTSAVSIDSYILSQSQRLASTQQRQHAGKKLTYKVKRGDTLWDIAKKYHVSTRNIAKWNGMAPKDTIKPGQKLVLWQKTNFQLSDHNTNNLVEQAVIRKITYKVRKGDSFARIANKFNVRISDIEKWNNISRKDYLQPGQMLKLSVDVTNSI